MARGKLLVRRKGFTRKDGTKVKGATFLIADRGRPGRGPEIIEVEREGAMAKHARNMGLLRKGMKITDLPDRNIEILARSLADKFGPATASRMFQAQISFRTRATGESLADRRKFEVGKEAIQRRFFPNS